ncbi:ubiquitin fusion degradation protein UFD1-domain-containing protein [Haematococcus lacustris]
MFGFLGGGFGGGTFTAQYRAMPVAFIDKQSAEFGDKVILPPSALHQLASLHIEYPMLFKVESTGGRTTHCGVLEFVAEEGQVYMPHWMMQNMLLQVGDVVRFTNVSLPKGTYVKLQPVTSDFLDITNPKAVLERTLRSYTCLTVGDCFVVNYNNKNYEIEVKEAKPNRAISVVETDCQVDFEAPKDYKEPEYKKPAPKPEAKQDATGLPGSNGSKAGKVGSNGSAPAAGDAGAATEAAAEEPTFLAFAGTARRLDGKAAVLPPAPVAVPLVSRHGINMSTMPSTSAPAAGAAKPSGAAGGAKAGTFVSTGNRLLDKLQKDKMAASGSPGAAAPVPPAPTAPAQQGPAAAGAVKDGADDSSNKFKAFQGTGRSLKG